MSVGWGLHTVDSLFAPQRACQLSARTSWLAAAVSTVQLRLGVRAAGFAHGLTMQAALPELCQWLSRCA